MGAQYNSGGLKGQDLGPPFYQSWPGLEGVSLLQWLNSHPSTQPSSASPDHQERRILITQTHRCPGPLEPNAGHWLWSQIAGAWQADLCVSFGHLDSKKAMSLNPRIPEHSAPFSAEKLVLEAAQKYCLMPSSDNRTPQPERGNTIGSREVK